uniref:Uncharacterized protein n=1 Tax=Tetradesmus obliquus TaxID=3088 RepID=A0A383VFG0_TETOB
MAQQQAAASKPGQLAVPNSNSSSCVFKPISSPGKLESLGLTPVPKVRVRPTSMKKKKPSALDKQYRHVALLQRLNRRAATQAAEQAAEQQRQQRELAGTCQQLRANILAGDTEAVLQTWQPAAAAAVLQEQQAAAAAAATQQSQHLHSSKLQGVYDLPHFRRSQSPQQSSAGLRAAVQQGSASWAGDIAACRNSETVFAGSEEHAYEQAAAAAAAVAAVQSADDDYVDSFLDGLLQQATAQKAGGSHMQSSSKAAGPCEQAAAAAATSRPGSAAGSAAAAASRAATSKQQKGKAKPAWALSEQQQAEAAAAAAAAAAAEAEAEEREVLQFAEGLSWEQIVGQLDDEQLAAAFQELDTAEQQAAAGDPAADKQWRRCFVTSLNHAVMQGVSAATAAAAAAGGTAGSETEQDKHSVASSASQARRAEAIAARRQKLLDRLSRIGGSGSRAGSSCGGASRFGGEHNKALAAGAEQDGWDGSTRVGGDDVALLTSALRGLEAGELLAECPEMKGVHSVASVRSMLLKAEGQK